MSYEVGYKKPPKHNPDIWPKLSATDQRVLYYLTDLADETKSRTIQVFVGDIAAYLGCTKRRVQSSLARLKEREYISIENVRNRRGGHEASRYTILNPEKSRRDKIRAAAEASGIPMHLMVEYVYWLVFHRDKLRKEIFPTVGIICELAHFPGSQDPSNFIRGLVTSGILASDKEIDF